MQSQIWDQESVKICLWGQHSFLSKTLTRFQVILPFAKIMCSGKKVQALCRIHSWVSALLIIEPTVRTFRPNLQFFFWFWRKNHLHYCWPPGPGWIPLSPPWRKSPGKGNAKAWGPTWSASLKQLAVVGLPIPSSILRYFDPGGGINLWTVRNSYVEKLHPHFLWEISQFFPFPHDFFRRRGRPTQFHRIFLGNIVFFLLTEKVPSDLGDAIFSPRVHRN